MQLEKSQLNLKVNWWIDCRNTGNNTFVHLYFKYRNKWRQIITTASLPTISFYLSDAKCIEKVKSCWWWWLLGVLRGTSVFSCTHKMRHKISELFQIFLFRSWGKMYVNLLYLIFWWSRGHEERKEWARASEKNRRSWKRSIFRTEKLPFGQGKDFEKEEGKM